MIFIHPIGKAMRDEDTGEGTSKRTGKKRIGSNTGVHSWPLVTE